MGYKQRGLYPAVGGGGGRGGAYNGNRLQKCFKQSSADQNTFCLYWLSLSFKTESTRKSSNFNFQWTKTFYHDLKHIASFFTFFQGLKM